MVVSLLPQNIFMYFLPFHLSIRFAALINEGLLEHKQEMLQLLAHMNLTTETQLGRAHCLDSLDKGMIHDSARFHHTSQNSVQFLKIMNCLFQNFSFNIFRL